MLNRLTTLTKPITMLTAAAVATAALVAGVALPRNTAKAAVYLPCAPNCTIDPCKIQKCK